MNEQQRYQRLEELFHQLVDLPEDERSAQMAALAGSDASLASALAAMFSRTNAASESVLDALAESAKALTQAAPLPERIGPYQIIRLLGEGGMGKVYEALQSEPVQRRVALKLTHAGLDFARFYSERQALAVFEHPNIARIYDFGTHTDGRPWFAMELVIGIPITQWASARELGLRDRLELLLPVCDAIQHAHRKGVIHRDLKPSNILVCEEDGKSVPKVIDFGIAKVVDAGQASNQATKAGELIGTPEYMSPEQASLGAIDIDTRSDVYALGLVLFELLVGQLPMTLADLRRLAFDEMCRRIREDDPPRPSTVLNRSKPGSGAHASGGWARRIQGDLDAVVLKALAKDREQRYDSAASLATDLRLFLADKPVQATPPRWQYRLQKLIKRNRTVSAITAAALIVVALASGWAVQSYGAAQRAAAAAVTARQEAEAVTAFLLDLFKAADPRAEPGKVPTARDLLARGLEQLNADTALAPDARLRLLESLGDAAFSLGDYGQAQAMFEQALKLHAARTPAQPLRQVFLQDRLGALARDRGDLALAEKHHRDALAILNRAGASRSSEAARAHNNLAIVLRRQGDLTAAAAQYEAAIDLTKQLQPAPNRQLASALLNLAAVHQDLGDLDAAKSAQVQALTIFQAVLPADHPDFATIYNNMSMVHRNAGALHEALDFIGKARANEAKNLPATHPDRADSLHNHAAVLLRLGQLDAAQSSLLEAKTLLTQTLGAQNPRLYVHRDSLAEIDLQRGNYVEASAALTGLLAEIPDQPATVRQRLTSWRKLAMAQRGAAQWDQAIASARQSLELVRTAARPNDQGLAHLLLALIALDQGQQSAAAAHYSDALKTLPECEQSACALDQASTNVLRAQYLARTADPATAVAALRHALHHRLWSASMLRHADLAPLHKHPDWSVLEQALAAKIADTDRTN